MSVNRRDGNRRHTDHSDWSKNPRWAEITRPYSYADVLRLRGTIQIEYTLARLGAERLWNLMHSDAYVAALGAVTGNQAIEMVQAGLKAIYGSGWQVAAGSNTPGDVYPHQSLYPCDRAPAPGDADYARGASPLQERVGEGNAEWRALVAADGG